MIPTLALKSELALAWQLVARHRAPRLALLLFATVVTWQLLESTSGFPSRRVETFNLVAGVLSSVAASRVTSRGAALASLRRTSSPRWVGPVGRWCGVLVFVLLPVSIAAAVLFDDPPGARTAAALLVVLSVYTGAISSLVMAATPVAGASAGAVLGILVSVAGGIAPSQLVDFLEDWPHLRAPLESAWNVLPFSWRVSHWLVAGGAQDALVLTAWLVAGIAATTGVAGWTQPFLRRTDA